MQYSVKKFLIVFTLAGCVLGTHLRRSYLQYRAVGLLESMGARCRFANQSTSDGLVNHAIPYASNAASFAPHLTNRVVNVTLISVTRKDTTDLNRNLAKSLKQFRHLKSLTLDGPEFTAESVSTLSTRNLNYLCAVRTKLSGDLSKLQNQPLKSVNLFKAEFSDDDLSIFYDAKNLEALNLGETNVTPAGIKRISEHLPNCQVSH